MKTENTIADSKSLLTFIISLLREQKAVLSCYLYKKAYAKFNNLDKAKVRRELRKAIKTLQQAGAITVNSISKRIFEINLANIGEALNLISRTAARNSNTQNQQTTITTAILPSRKLKASELWKKLNPLRLKARLQQEERWTIQENFELWIEDMRYKLLLFQDFNGEYQIIPPRNRFINPGIAIETLKKLEMAFKRGQEHGDKAVFLTITLPPIFPLQVQKWILSFLLHRIKALLRRKTGKNCPHIRVNEPHKDYRLHLHVIIFGTGRITKRRQLTEYLEKHLSNFLTNLGKHYKKTINRRATDEEVEALNQYGQRLLRKYRRYKRKHPKYKGPVNKAITIKNTEEGFVFEEDPGDDHRKRRTMRDGGQQSVLDYVKFYVAEAASEAVKASKQSPDKPYKIKSDSLAFFWYARIPFFTLSPSLYEPKPKPPPQGWVFLGAVTMEEAAELLGAVI